MADNEKINETVEEIKEKVNDVVSDVKEDVKEAYAKASVKAGELKEDVKEAYAKASVKAQEKVEEIKREIDDYTAELDPDDVKNNKVMAVLAYIGILVLVPVFFAKESKFARFHANQGLVLFLISIVCSILMKLKVIGWIFKLVAAVTVLLAIVGIIYAVQGKAKELPVVGNWKILK